MKKAAMITGAVFAVLLTAFPVGAFLTALFGYTLEVTRPALFAVLIALAAMAFAAVCTVGKVPFAHKVWSVLCALAAPLSLIAAAVYLFRYGTMIWVVGSMAVCVGCCVYLAIRYGKPLEVKLVGLILSALLVVPISFITFIMVVFADLGYTSVVRTVESPNGIRYAEVIDSDQGALGGDTLVKVYRSGGVDVLLFRISPTPQTVYTGDWRVWEHMEIYWRDDDWLVINGVDHLFG